jgi:hypothetical protein
VDSLFRPLLLVIANRNVVEHGQAFPAAVLLMRHLHDQQSVEAIELRPSCLRKDPGSGQLRKGPSALWIARAQVSQG